MNSLFWICTNDLGDAFHHENSKWVKTDFVRIMELQIISYLPVWAIFKDIYW